MHIDWRVKQRIENVGSVWVIFEPVEWVKPIVDPDDPEAFDPDDSDAYEECNFDDVDGFAVEREGEMRVRFKDDGAARFEVGKTYRATFG